MISKKIIKELRASDGIGWITALKSAPAATQTPPLVATSNSPTPDA